MLMVDADKVAAALDYPRLVEALRNGHQRGVYAVERLLMSQARATSPTNHLLVWPAWQHDDLLGAKLVSVFPGNRPPDPSISTVYVLFDGRNGRPLACINRADVRSGRTARFGRRSAA